MIVVVWNALLTLIWAAATGQFSLANLLVGFVLSYAILWFLRPLLEPTTYFRKSWSAPVFVLFFLKQLIRANLRVAYDVITPTFHMRPAVVAVSLDARTDLEIMLLANLISLTPGTLSVDVSSDRRVLFVHSMFVDDADQLRHEIKDGLERLLLELMR